MKRQQGQTIQHVEKRKNRKPEFIDPILVLFEIYCMKSSKFQ